MVQTNIQNFNIYSQRSTRAVGEIVHSVLVAVFEQLIRHIVVKRRISSFCSNSNTNTYINEDGVNLFRFVVESRDLNEDQEYLEYIDWIFLYNDGVLV